MRIMTSYAQDGSTIYLVTLTYCGLAVTRATEGETPRKRIEKQLETSTLPQPINIKQLTKNKLRGP
jgi:hypothetical protein